MEKRRRFPLEVFEACRALVPPDKALGIRLSAPPTGSRAA